MQDTVHPASSPEHVKTPPSPCTITCLSQGGQPDGLRPPRTNYFPCGRSHDQKKNKTCRGPAPKLDPKATVTAAFEFGNALSTIPYPCRCGPKASAPAWNRGPPLQSQLGRPKGKETKLRPDNLAPHNVRGEYPLLLVVWAPNLTVHGTANGRGHHRRWTNSEQTHAP